jgi:hypothetical protein
MFALVEGFRSTFGNRHAGKSDVGCKQAAALGLEVDVLAAA